MIQVSKPDQVTKTSKVVAEQKILDFDHQLKDTFFFFFQVDGSNVGQNLPFYFYLFIKFVM